MLHKNEKTTKIKNADKRRWEKEQEKRVRSLIILEPGLKSPIITQIQYRKLSIAGAKLKRGILCGIGSVKI